MSHFEVSPLIADAALKAPRLKDQAFTSTEENGSRLLLHSLGFNEPHLGPLRCDYDRLSALLRLRAARH